MVGRPEGGVVGLCSVRGWLAITLVLGIGCGGDAGTSHADAGARDGGTSASDGGEVPALDAPGPVDDVTYYGDVRPILARHCVACHVEGGIGPFPLDRYEVVRPLATRIAQVTRERIMPPYLADNSGECQSFRDARWLSDREIEVLRAWDEQGEPEGDPTTPPPEVPPPPTLSGSITTLDIGVDYAPDTSAPDEYRCFVVDPISSEDVFITGYDVHPGNRRIVHHVIVYAPADAAAGDEARRLDAAEAGPGYTCFGAARVDAFPVVLWAPGGGATQFPEGTGMRHPGGIPLVVQVHYNTLAGGGTDRTTVDLQTVPRGVRNARFLPLADWDMAVAPRMAHVETSATVSLADYVSVDLPITIYGTFPHMHTLGRTLRVDHFASETGTEQCLLEVPRWDFNWQLAYWYATPVTISTLDSLRITCSYDTTERTETVRWGEGTQDEMCLNFFYAVVAGGL